MVLSGSLQPAFDEIDGLKELLPAEYGGTNGHFDEIFGKSIKGLRKKIILTVHPNGCKRAINELYALRKVINLR